ncbi:MAG: hypothetical protein EB075_12005 [Bacteroidetes bacterium]|nr:hypothetical protein [Bacteroidota bacterium]
MAFLLNHYLPPPQNADLFIHLCTDLYARVFNDPSIHRHSLHGGSRHEVDLWGYEDGAGELFGIHCAFCGLDGSMVPDKSELRAVIEATWDFRPKINHLVIVTNIANDDVVQQVRRNANALTAKRPYFRCDVVGWLEVQRLIGMHASLVEKYYPSAMNDLEELNVASDATPQTPTDGAVLPALSNVLYQMRNRNRSEREDPFVDLPHQIHDTCPGCGTSIADWVVVCPSCGAHIVRGATPEELISFSTVVFFFALMCCVAIGRYLTAWVPFFPGWATALVLSVGCGVVSFFVASWIGRYSRRVRGADYHSPVERVRYNANEDTSFPPSPF